MVDYKFSISLELLERMNLYFSYVDSFRKKIFMCEKYFYSLRELFPEVVMLNEMIKENVLLRIIVNAYHKLFMIC